MNDDVKKRKSDDIAEKLFQKGWERSRERRKWRNRCLLSVLVVALGTYLYFKHQERVSPVLLSLKPFGCDHFTASGQDAHRDALGELNYSVQLRCEDTGNPLSAKRVADRIGTAFAAHEFDEAGSARLSERTAKCTDAL